MMKLAPCQIKWLGGLLLLVTMILIGNCASPNQAPVVSSLAPSAKVISRTDSIEVKSVASDPDGDELDYIWSASDGDISREGSVIFWTAPGTSGNYTITVQVTDGKGGEASESVSIEVVRTGVHSEDRGSCST
jgi:hypothetical protein